MHKTDNRQDVSTAPGAAPGVAPGADAMAAVLTSGSGSESGSVPASMPAAVPVPDSGSASGSDAGSDAGQRCRVLLVRLTPGPGDTAVPDINWSNVPAYTTAPAGADAGTDGGRAGGTAEESAQDLAGHKAADDILYALSIKDALKLTDHLLQPKGACRAYGKARRRKAADSALLRYLAARPGSGDWLSACVTRVMLEWLADSASRMGQLMRVAALEWVRGELETARKDGVEYVCAVRPDCDLPEDEEGEEDGDGPVVEAVPARRRGRPRRK